LNDIRVTYSGLIAFSVSILSSVTGLIFVIIVTRRLEADEFGLWTLIGSMVGYVVIAQPIITFWCTRQVSRGEQVGKTAIFTGGIFSICGFVIYSIIIIFVAASLEASLTVLFLSALLIPFSYLNNIINSISMGFKPQVTSYGIAIFEISKLPLGFILVYIFDFGISGALLTLILANGMKMLVLAFFTREKLVGEIKHEVMKFWFRMSWLTLYQNVGSFIRTLDVMIFSLLTGSLLGLAFWGASITIGNLMLHSQKLYQGLYPKILTSEKKEFVIISFNRTLYFAIPIFCAILILAKPSLYILNPQYIIASTVVYFTASFSFVNIINGFFYSVLMGYEKVDISKNTSFKQYAKSKLFLVPTLSIIYSVSYISLLTFFLIYLITPATSDIEILTVWSFILFVLLIPFMIYSGILVKKNHQINFNFIPITKYAGIALLSTGMIFYISENYIIYYESIYDFIPQVFLILIIGAIIYFGITYAVDNSTRKLFNSIIIEIIKK